MTQLYAEPSCEKLQNSFITQEPRKFMYARPARRFCLEAVGLKNRPNFMDYSLTPAIREGFVCMKYPANPHHPRQRYLLSVKGLMWLDGNNS